jgi:hypothetical protein
VVGQRIIDVGRCAEVEFGDDGQVGWWLPGNLSFALSTALADGGGRVVGTVGFLLSNPFLRLFSYHLPNSEPNHFQSSSTY